MSLIDIKRKCKVCIKTFFSGTIKNYFIKNGFFAEKMPKNYFNRKAYDEKKVNLWKVII